MAFLNIQEYSGVGGSGGGAVPQIAREPAVTTQQVTASGTSAQSSAFNASTNYVRLIADVAVYIAFGSDPTAVDASDLYLPAGTAEYFGITPGHKVAVITA